MVESKGVDDRHLPCISNRRKTRLKKIQDVRKQKIAQSVLVVKKAPLSIVSAAPGGGYYGPPLGVIARLRNFFPRQTGIVLLRPIFRWVRLFLGRILLLALLSHLSKAIKSFQPVRLGIFFSHMVKLFS
ncbi:hypothetical protein Nepgr_014142 [Nepenthes gracilis]|uniref:Uncharacterized protein n=1 Tax=Nepenthes gracilis TaxID=150966 RepID=A0AAD3XQ08_NEPGR|nr:hypothetical protein Nepgr_014142 [Nepenthes gracilis]